MTNATNPKPVRTKPITYIILGVIAAGCFASIWWFGPWNAANRYSRMTLVDLRHVLDREPNNAKAWKQFAIRLTRDGDATLAEPALLRALELNKNDPILSTGLGEIYMTADRFPEAFHVLKSASSSNPNDSAVHRAMGELYVRKESYLHAKEQYEIVVHVDSKAADAWYQIAACSLQLQQTASAGDAIKHAISLQPDNPTYLAEEGAVDVAVGNVSKGITETGRAALLAPTDIRIQSANINLLLEQHRDENDVQAADAAIGRLEQLAPNFPPIPYMRGRLEMAKQHWAAAARYLEMALAAAPLHDEIRLALSQAYRRMDRPADADALLKQYRFRQQIRQQIGGVQEQLSATPRDVSLYARLADLEMQLEDKTAAYEVMKTGLQINPKDARLQKWFGQLQRMMPPQK